jgi:hypothetical protein
MTETTETTETQADNFNLLKEVILSKGVYKLTHKVRFLRTSMRESKAMIALVCRDIDMVQWVIDNHKRVSRATGKIDKRGY